VDTDRSIKVIFLRQGESLLPYVGEVEARVTGADSPELPVPRRVVDCVLRLERDGFVWYRHLEFQSSPDPDMSRRCFEYNTRLLLHYRAPVLTTVVYLLPEAARGAQEAFRVYLGDRLVNEWRFDTVRLWEIDAATALESGQAGPLALVPLLRGGGDPAVLAEAARRLDALPGPGAADAMSVLVDLASGRYDWSTLMGVLGKERAMESYLWQEGRKEGEAAGQIDAARRICLDLAREFHPSVASRVAPVIQGCRRPVVLRRWALQCAKLSDAAFVRLVAPGPASRRSRSRVGGPSRTSRRAASTRKAR